MIRQPRKAAGQPRTAGRRSRRKPSGTRLGKAEGLSVSRGEAGDGQPLSEAWQKATRPPAAKPAAAGALTTGPRQAAPTRTARPPARAPARDRRARRGG